MLNITSFSMVSYFHSFLGIIALCPICQEGCLWHVPQKAWHGQGHSCIVQSPFEALPSAKDIFCWCRWSFSWSEKSSSRTPYNTHPNFPEARRPAASMVLLVKWLTPRCHATFDILDASGKPQHFGFVVQPQDLVPKPHQTGVLQ